MKKINENLSKQLEDYQKKSDLNELKLNKYIEKFDQIQKEKLNLELEISKNNSELLQIRQEVTDFHEKLMKKDYKIIDLQNKLENYLNLDNQKSILFDSPPRNLKNDLNGLISDISVNHGDCIDNINISQFERFELQKDELMQKEKELKHLMEKCKELQNQNSEFRSKNEKMCEENKKISLFNKNSLFDLKKENKRLGEELLKINEVYIFFLLLF